MNYIDINNILITIAGYPVSYVEFIGTVTGLFSVWLAAKSNILTWPVGLINVICFYLIFFQVHLYADMLLQVYFFVMTVYGWYAWHKEKPDSKQIEKLSLINRSRIIVGIAVATVIIGFLVKDIHLIMPAIFKVPASYPFIDTFVALMSVVATVLLARRIIENWILWIAVDVISVVLYMKKSVLLISAEYFVFLLLAAWGLINWLKISRDVTRLSNR